MRATERWVLAATLAGVATTGCASERSVPAGEVVDSAGVRIVTYDLAGIAVPAHRVVAGHDLEIGVQDGAPEYTFSRITDLAVADDGSIVVSDAVAQELRVYDADGVHRATIGGSGDGPGEFGAPPLITGLAGDTVFAFDPRASRVTSFTSSGELLRLTTFRSDDIGRPRLMVRQDDGTYLSQSAWTAPRAAIEFYDPRLELDSIVIEHVDGSGGLLDTIRVMPDRNMGRTVEDRGAGSIGVLQAPRPFGARAFTRGDGARIIVGRSDAFELWSSTPGRGTATVLRVRGARNPMTAEELRARQELALREDFGEEEIPPLVRRLNLDFLPDRLPAFGDLVVSDAGDLWVARSEYDDSEGFDWLVFTPGGELRGEVHTPPGLHVRAIGRDFIVGFVLDELDVPYLRRYPLLPPQGTVGDATPNRSSTGTSRSKS